MAVTHAMIYIILSNQVAILAKSYLAAWKLHIS